MRFERRAAVSAYSVPRLRAAVCIAAVAACASCSSLQEQMPAASRYLIDEQQFMREYLDVPASAPPRARRESFEERVTILPAAMRRAVTASAAMTLRAERLPLPVFTRMLSRASGYSVVADADAAAGTTLSLRLDGVAWRDALDTVAGLHGLVVHERASARLLRLRPGGDAEHAAAARDGEARQVEMFRLRFARPAEVKPLLDALFERDGERNGKAPAVRAVVVSDERSQAVIVKGGRRDLALAASLIRELDTRHQQVLIEAFIVEAGSDFQRNLGARLARDDAGRRLPRIYGAATGDSFVNLPAAGAVAGLGLRFGKSRIRLELTALENEGKSRIVSNPRVFTLDNQPAVIFQGDEIPYQTVSEDGTRTEFKQAGLRLAVTPSVIDDDHLLLDVAINKDTVDTRVQNPPITRREISSRLLVADGDMVVIGGIRLNTRVDAQDRVPVAGELPVVGGLFRGTRAQRDVRELMVFILPEIVR